MGQRASKPAKASAAVLRPQQGVLGKGKQERIRGRATDKKWERNDPELVAESQDPHFLENLRLLGQVPVSSPALTTASSYRQPGEQEEVRNRVTSRALSNLFHELRTSKSQTEAKELADRYELDLDVLQQLSKRFTAPLVHRTEEQGRFLAKWESNILESRSEQ